MSKKTQGHGPTKFCLGVVHVHGYMVVRCRFGVGVLWCDVGGGSAMSVTCRYHKLSCLGAGDVVLPVQTMKDNETDPIHDSPMSLNVLICQLKKRIAYVFTLS